jgi:hypothetical protein
MKTGRFSCLVSTAAPQRTGSLSAILIVDPGKIFINTPGVTFRKKSDGCPGLKREQVAHCSRVQR